MDINYLSPRRLIYFFEKLKTCFAKIDHTHTKSEIGLSNVENKSSTTIRSELTKSDVTTALGYTPPTSNTTYSVATASTAGLLSATDKAKLDGITSSADSVSFTANLTSGTKVGTITINGADTDLYCQTNTDTKVSITATNPTASVVYYIPFSSSANSTGIGLLANDGLRLRSLQGTTTEEGYDRLYLGNNISTGTAGNKSGSILIYTSGSTYITYEPYNVTSSVTRYLVGTSSSVAVGSSTAPVYVSSTGTISACGDSLSVSVTGNAATATKVYSTLTNPETTTTYCIPFHSTPSSADKSLLNNNGLTVTCVEGTTDAVGRVDLRLGNSTTSGTAGNKRGRLRIYNPSSGYTDVLTPSSTEDYTITLPAATGTVALTSGNIATATALTSSAGSATQPVYFNEGKPVKCTYTLGKSVPSTAVFTDTTYSNMTAATASAAGKAGLVPAPAAGKQTSFLRGDGAWAIPTNTTYSAAGSSLGLVKSGGDVTITSGVITVVDNSHNHSKLVVTTSDGTARTDISCGSTGQVSIGNSELTYKSIVIDPNSGHIRPSVTGNYSVGASSYKFQNGFFSNDVTAATWTTSSKVEFKQDIQKYTDNALDIVMSCDVYTYRLKSDVAAGKDYINTGFIIGDGYNLSQQIISSNGEGINMYSALATSYKAIQELKEEITSLKVEIAELKNI